MHAHSLCSSYRLIGDLVHLGRAEPRWHGHIIHFVIRTWVNDQETKPSENSLVPDAIIYTLLTSFPSVFSILSSEAWIGGFKLCVISEDLKSVYSFVEFRGWKLCTQLVKGKTDIIPFPHPLQHFVEVILVDKIVRTTSHWEIIFIKTSVHMPTLLNNQLHVS